MHWLPAGHRAVLVKRRAWVDLGGIAKGYAVDLAVAALRRAGADAGLVNAGGDLRAYGPDSWPLWLRTGTSPARELLLRDCALAASDANSLSRPREHQGYYSGRGGANGRQPAAVAIVAPSAALADALTKIVMQATPAQSARILGRCRAHTVSCP